jgi:phenylacetate-CoA ligase
MAILYPEIECATEEKLALLRWDKLKKGLRLVAHSNGFYRRKWEKAGVSADDIRRLEDISILPFTEKSEFLKDQAENPPYGTNLTRELGCFTRYHQTTGTTGSPLKWIDSNEGWAWRTRCAAMAMSAAGISEEDVCFFPFPFSPHSAFWGLFEGSHLLGALSIAGGGWTTEQRIKFIEENYVSVLACTPSYSLHLARAAKEKGKNLRNRPIKVLIHSGEPGAIVPYIRDRIEESYNARSFDYLGMTEVGAHSFQCDARSDALHVIESEFIVEVIDPISLKCVPNGEIGELTVTNLGRWDSPAIRFRTGDLVRVGRGKCDCGRTFCTLEGGILGRRDQMIVVRGINVYPELVGNIIGPFLREGEEWQMVVEAPEGEPQISVKVELEPFRIEAKGLLRELSESLKLGLELSVNVIPVAPGAIERKGVKFKRLLDLRPR